MLHRGSNCSLVQIMDGRIMCCGIISLAFTSTLYTASAHESLLIQAMLYY